MDWLFIVVLRARIYRSIGCQIVRTEISVFTSVFSCRFGHRIARTYLHRVTKAILKQQRYMHFLVQEILFVNVTGFTTYSLTIIFQFWVPRSVFVLYKLKPQSNCTQVHVHTYVLDYLTSHVFREVERRSVFEAHFKLLKSVRARMKNANKVRKLREGTLDVWKDY